MEEFIDMKAYDIMTPEIRYIDKKTSIKDVAIRMINEGIGALIVTDQDNPIGIVTKRDIIWGVLFEKRDPEKDTVDKIMSSPMITIDYNADLYTVIDTMIRNNITHLPVREGDKIVGIISDYDLIIVLRDLLDMIKSRSLRSTSSEE